MIYNIQSSYKTYKQLCKVENIYPINRYIYFSICSDFMLFLSIKLLKGFRIKLPEALGFLQVVGNKQVIKIENGISKRKIDWYKTNLLWKKNEKAKQEKKFVYYSNEHSKGYIYKLRWIKNNAILINKNIYGFVVSNILKKKLAKEIKNGQEYYIINTINSIATK